MKLCDYPHCRNLTEGKFCSECAQKELPVNVYRRNYAQKNEQIHSKVLARAKLRWAIRSGKIKREPCAKCGYVFVQGHHTDYSQPLKVQWLCKEHHDQEHLKQLHPAIR